MWSWLIPLFFFAAPLGSPVPGFLVFGLLGLVHAWQSWKGVQHRNSFVWSHEDSVLAACFMSIPLFNLGLLCLALLASHWAMVSSRNGCSPDNLLYMVPTPAPLYPPGATGLWMDLGLD